MVGWKTRRIKNSLIVKNFGMYSTKIWKPIIRHFLISHRLNLVSLIFLFLIWLWLIDIIMGQLFYHLSSFKLFSCNIFYKNWRSRHSRVDSDSRIEITKRHNSRNLNWEEQIRMDLIAKRVLLSHVSRSGNCNPWAKYARNDRFVMSTVKSRRNFSVRKKCLRGNLCVKSLRVFTRWMHILQYRFPATRMSCILRIRQSEKEVQMRVGSSDIH